MIANALRGEGFDASEDGTGRGTPIVPVVARTLTRGAESSGKGGYAGRRQEDDDNLVCHAIQAGALRENPDSGPDGVGVQSGIAYTIEARPEVQAVAFQERGRDGGRSLEWQEGISYSLNAPSGGGRRNEFNISTGWAVRRLTPTECERLQGFPDGYTNIVKSADGQRYKALGNSMACNVMRWVGRRIQMVDDMTKEKAAEAA